MIQHWLDHALKSKSQLRSSEAPLKWAKSTCNICRIKIGPLHSNHQYGRSVQRYDQTSSPLKPKDGLNLSSILSMSSPNGSGGFTSRSLSPENEPISDSNVNGEGPDLLFTHIFQIQVSDSPLDVNEGFDWVFVIRKLGCGTTRTSDSGGGPKKDSKVGVQQYSCNSQLIIVWDRRGPEWLSKGIISEKIPYLMPLNVSSDARPEHSDLYRNGIRSFNDLVFGAWFLPGGTSIYTKFVSHHNISMPNWWSNQGSAGKSLNVFGSPR